MDAHHDGAPLRRARISSVLVVTVAATLAVLLMMTATPRVTQAQAHEPETGSVTAATPDDAGERIVRTAMRYVGQHGGQCFTFVRQVIAEATGISMGFGYHQGFLEGGAVEVPLSEAQRGDVIQIAHATNNGPGVDYPGLHTAIVMTNNGDGTFDVVDSNYGWDEMVSAHENYNPSASAARNGLSARAYRFSKVAPGTQQAVDGGAPLSSSAELLPGEQARIATDTGGSLYFRSTPTIGDNIIRALANGSFVTLLEGKAEADGYVWRQVQVGGETGWVAEVYLAQATVIPTSAARVEDATQESNDALEETDDTIEEGSTFGQILSGALPPSGGLALMMWGGGSVEQLHTIATDGGCQLLSLWSTADGGLIGHIIGAPEFVNATWVEHFPGDLPERTALLAVCARPDTGDEFAPPTSPPDGEFIEGEGPPGPAGNEGENAEA